MNLDPSREARQMDFVRRWGKARCCGTLEAVTGFGKTVAALLGAKNLLTKYSLPRDPDWNATVIVVVPTEHLKKKWEQDLIDWEIPDSEVWIINSIVKLHKLRCRLLILDEVHWYTGDIFRTVFDVIEYSQILGLTATLPEEDERKTIITDYAPVVDTVGMEECLNNGWTSEYQVYNLGIELTPEERILYDEYSESFSKTFGIFGHNFDSITRSLNNPAYRAKLAGELGWNQGALLGAAKNCLQGMRKRGDILHTSESKVQTAVEICKHFPDYKILTFSQVTSVSNILTEILGEESRPYHSDLKGQIINGKKVGKDKARAFYLEGFARGDFRILNSAKALDMGADIPTIDMSIVLSGNSKMRQGIQRLGRILRKLGDKVAIEVNLYALGTQDEKWLRSRQQKIPGTRITWINSIEEIQT